MDASTWTTDGRATGVNEGSGAGATSISSPTASSGIEPAGPSPEEEFRSRVNSFVEDVVKAGKKRKQVYSVTSATVISIRDGLAEVAKRVEDCTTMKSSIVKEMKALVDTIDVGGAKKRQQFLAGSASGGAERGGYGIALKRLDLGGCKRITSRGVACIAKTCVRLEHLDLRGVEQVDDAAMTACSRLPALQSLNITGCAGVTEEGFAFFEDQKGARACAVVGRAAKGTGINYEREAEGKRRK